MTANETIPLVSPGLDEDRTVPCGINCLWLIHASNVDYKIYVEIEQFRLSDSDSFLIGNGDNPRDNSSIFVGTDTRLSTGIGFGSSNSTIWVVLQTSSCDQPDQSGGTVYYKFKLEEINGSSKNNLSFYLLKSTQCFSYIIDSLNSFHSFVLLLFILTISHTQ